MNLSAEAQRARARGAVTATGSQGAGWPPEKGENVPSQPLHGAGCSYVYPVDFSSPSAHPFRAYPEPGKATLAMGSPCLSHTGQD